LIAQLGSLSALVGCSTRAAETARQDAEQWYFRSQETHHKKILKRTNRE